MYYDTNVHKYRVFWTNDSNVKDIFDHGIVLQKYLGKT